MKNRTGNILWGLVFIILGVGLAGNVFELWNFEVFFDGWWTLLIIVPCIISMVQHGVGPVNMFLLITGVLLLLSAQDMIQGVAVRELIIPVGFIMIGFALIFKDKGVKKNHRQCTVTEE